MGPRRITGDTHTGTMIEGGIKVDFLRVVGWVKHCGLCNERGQFFEA